MRLAERPHHAILSPQSPHHHCYQIPGSENRPLSVFLAFLGTFQLRRYYLSHHHSCLSPVRVESSQRSVMIRHSISQHPAPVLRAVQRLDMYNTRFRRWIQPVIDTDEKVIHFHVIIFTFSHFQSNRHTLRFSGGTVVDSMTEQHNSLMIIHWPMAAAPLFNISRDCATENYGS